MLLAIRLRKFLTKIRILGRVEESKLIIFAYSLPSLYPVKLPYHSHRVPFRVASDISSPISLPPPRPLSTLWWSSQTTMYPISDLTTFCKKTLGDVPPRLVVCIQTLRSEDPHFHSCFQGASTTVVGSKVYLYVRPNSTANRLRLIFSCPGRSSRRRASDGHGHLHVRHRNLHMGKDPTES